MADLANHLGRLGDDSPLGDRRAAALGLLAHPERVLDLSGQPDRPPPVERDRRTTRSPARPSTCTSPATTYAALPTTARPPPRTSRSSVPPPSTCSRPGSSGPRHHPQARPRHEDLDDALDAHDPPAWMRDLVILRDGHCVFPGCTIDARRCDLDHIDPYVPMGEGGHPAKPPSELGLLLSTTPPAEDLHRLGYQRADPGTYAWTNPHGLTYRANPQPSTDTTAWPAQAWATSDHADERASISGRGWFVQPGRLLKASY